MRYVAATLRRKKSVWRMGACACFLRMFVEAEHYTNTLISNDILLTSDVYINGTLGRSRSLCCELDTLWVAFPLSSLCHLRDGDTPSLDGSIRYFGLR
jgi:hypothetical protein